MTFWDFLVLCLAIYYRREIWDFLVYLLIVLAGNERQWKEMQKRMNGDDE
ncbi:hypothetical protein [Castellaniella sp.]|nr:hypothetical protein [Castellaniella sp.]